MAYVPNQNEVDPNDPNAVPGGNGGAAAPVDTGIQDATAAPQTSTGIGGDAGAGTTAPGSPQGVSAAPTTSKAPPVQDLGAYLRANAPQSVQMGQNIAGKLNQTAQRATGDIDTAANNVNTGIQAATVAPNADLVGRAAKDPTAFVSNPDDVKAFQAQRDAAYTGPNNFQETPDWSGANAEVNSAIQTAPDITSDTGIHQLVRSQEKNPTLGMENLDALLLQQNPDALAPISTALPGVKNLGQYLSGKTTSTNAAIQDAIAKTAAAKQGVQDTFLTGPNAVAPGFSADLTSRVGTARTAAQAKEDEINNALNAIAAMKPATFDRTTLSNATNKLGADLPNEPYVGKYLGAYGNLLQGPIRSTDAEQPVSPFQYLTELSPNNEILPSNVATSGDYSKDAALASLLGTGYNPILDQANAGKAGTAPTDLTHLDTKTAYNQLADRLNEIITKYGNASAYQKYGYINE